MQFFHGRRPFRHSRHDPCWGQLGSDIWSPVPLLLKPFLLSHLGLYGMCQSIHCKSHLGHSADIWRVAWAEPRTSQSSGHVFNVGHLFMIMFWPTVIYIISTQNCQGRICSLMCLSTSYLIVIINSKSRQNMFRIYFNLAGSTCGGVYPQKPFGKLVFRKDFKQTVQ